MLERYFVRPATIDRIRASWIGKSIEQYVTSLADNGYAARNVFRRVPMLVQFGAFAHERGARRVDELPAHLDAFVEKWTEQHGSRCTTTVARKKVASEVRNPVEQMLRLAVPDFCGRRRLSVSLAEADSGRCVSVGYLQPRGLDFLADIAATEIVSSDCSSASAIARLGAGAAIRVIRKVLTPSPTA